MIWGMQYKWSADEKGVLTVLKANDTRMNQVKSNIHKADSMLEANIKESEVLLRSLGRKVPISEKVYPIKQEPRVLQVESWEDIYQSSVKLVGECSTIEDILSNEEVLKVQTKLNKWNLEFKDINRMDSIEWSICALAGILAAAVDIFFVQMPKHSKSILGEGENGGSLSNWIRDKVNQTLTPEQIKQLEKENWVPYDASTSKNLSTKVDGLYPKTHRLHSLGHDPILGFIFGVKDIMNGTMTTIDSKGRLITQIVNIKDKDIVGMNLFEALMRQIGHLKSDISTPAGLPIPFWGVLQKAQFGDIGGEHTIAEISRMMYTQGYDFRHFLAMSIPVMIIECIVRGGYTVKSLYEGKSIKDSIPIISKKSHKLNSMLFVAHTIATAANLGKVCFTSNPLSINAPQWTSFFRYGMKELAYQLIHKEKERHSCIEEKIENEWEQVYSDLEEIIQQYKVSYSM